jgi:hypothetical protein
MNKPTNTMRRRLIGKSLIGFNTNGPVRAPSVKAGNEGVVRSPVAKAG